MSTEIFNPPYFEFCNLAELRSPRGCFQPIYGNGCLNTTSSIYEAPVAFWTSVYEHVIPEVKEGVPVQARSAVWGFEPFFFEPAQVRIALELILFDEWQLEPLGQRALTSGAGR